MSNRLRELLDARRFSREQAETLLALLAATPAMIEFNLAPATWSAQPAAGTPLFGAAVGSRAIPIDLGRYTEAAISASVTTAGASGAALRLYWAKASPLSGGSYSPATAVSCGIGAAGIVFGGWSPIPAEARGPGFVDVWGVGGNASASPVIGRVTLWLR